MEQAQQFWPPKKGHRVFVSDKGLIENKYKEVLSQYRIEFEDGKHTEELIFAADEIIKSPGIPDEIDLIRRVKALSKPVISELEFAGRYTRAKKVVRNREQWKNNHHLTVIPYFEKCWFGCRFMRQCGGEKYGNAFGRTRL